MNAKEYSYIGSVDFSYFYEEEASANSNDTLEATETDHQEGLASPTTFSESDRQEELVDPITFSKSDRQEELVDPMTFPESGQMDAPAPSGEPTCSKPTNPTKAFPTGLVQAVPVLQQPSPFPILSQTSALPAVTNYGGFLQKLHYGTSKVENQVNEYSEIKLCSRFIQIMREHGQYLHREGDTVYLWNGQYYHRCSDLELKELLMFYMNRDLEVSGRASQLNNIPSVLRADPDISGGVLKLADGWINVTNGLLNIRTGELKAHDPRVFATTMLCTSWIPEASCPRFDEFLRTVTGADALLTQRFWEVLGCILVGDNRAKRFYPMQGVSNSGKSTFGNLLKSFFLPEDVSSLDLADFGKRFALESVVNARLNISMDLSDKVIGTDAVAKIKMITGGDSIRVEAKYKDAYDAIPRCILLFGSNAALRLSFPDDAFMNRCVVLPFRISIPEEARQRGLDVMLQQEQPGILRKAVAAYQVVVANNYVFTLDDTITASQSKDPYDEGIAAFISASCSYTPGSSTPTETLFTQYTIFCCNNGLPCLPTSASFSRAFWRLVQSVSKDVQKEKRRYNGPPQNGFRNIQLRS